MVVDKDGMWAEQVGDVVSIHLPRATSMTILGEEIDGEVKLDSEDLGVLVSVVRQMAAGKVLRQLGW